MDSYLNNLRQGASRRVDMAPSTAVTSWYRSNNNASTPTKRDNVTVTKHEFSAANKREYDDDKAKSSSASSASESESDGEGGRKKKAKSSKKKKKGDGKKKGGSICWDGYERVPGTAPYSDGSCQKK